ncbi:succinate dehydrogenase [Aeromicrobium sp. PE09-221]|uniref:succinate dehydrogenase cytochrome b subunit n=1 Tax=Aeromicrobium sp. PE09-221 TaxID=1898043 RepID=UPI000B3E6B49|nr:succinate dehydrogenase cytochrome b subunit [Aeromicrobium sp. PE09-221]OUZ08553.1 succinate dehydrogenase [Aeromicrobium sp. PE09-221]
MASTQLTKKRVPASRSTVAMKYAMAVSGLIMVGYLILHMYGNLKVFGGQEAFDAYAHHLRTFGEPMLPYEGLLWIVRVALLASVLVHAWAAITLWRRNKAAAGYSGGKRYHSSKGATGVQRSYASFTLRWGGVIILVFIVYHLLHLTANVISPGGASDSPYQRTVNGFEIWWVVLSYTIAVLAVGLHLWHGIWSALTTLGQNRSKTRLASRLTPLAWFVSAVITIGFLLPPWAILLGITG